MSMEPQSPAGDVASVLPGRYRLPPRIFISYRRADSAAITHRIVEKLVASFGKGSVFIDVEDIPFGTDFRRHIKQILSDCSIALVIIGQRWRGNPSDDLSRIADENDPVRVEIQTALQNGVTVIPVLVDNAAMPQPSELPEEIRAFSYLNAAMVDVGRNFQVDIDRVIASISGDRTADEASDHRRSEGPAAGSLARFPGGFPTLCAAVGIGAVGLPIASHQASLAPPWPPGAVYLTLAVLLMIIVVAFQAFRSWRPAAVAKALTVSALVLAIACSAYLLAVSFFTYQTPTTRERWVRGYTCTAEALLLYKDKCPHLGVDELRGAEYEAERLWTAASVGVVKVGLVGLWLLMFAAIATMVSAFLARHAPRLHSTKS